MLKEFTGPKHRYRRSYIDYNGVGNLFKLLFGTLDSTDAKKYDEEIEKLIRNEHDAFTLLKTQSKIVNTTILIIV